MSQIYAPTALTKGVKGALMRALSGQDGKSLLGRVGMLVPSDSDSETYAWLGESPRMRELTDDAEIIYDGMSDASYSLTNAIWKAGILVKRKDFDDQKWPAISKRIQGLATTARNHINRLIIDSLINGDVDNDYTGETFFNNTHAARGQQTATQDNIHTGTGVTVAQVQADVMDAVEMLMGLLAENNEPFDEMIQEVTVVYPTGLHGSMVDATKGELISNTSNKRFGDFTVNLIPTARLNADDANDYYVLNTSNKEDLPILIQERDPLEVKALLDGDDAFDREHYKYSVRWRGVRGFGHWQRAVKVTNT